MLRTLRHPLALPLGLWTLVWGLFFATLLFGRSRLPVSDFSAQFHAFARHQARELWQGHWPLWSNGSYGGFPFHADPQAAIYYPPRLLLILFNGPRELPFAWLQAEGMIHLWLAGCLTILFTYSLLSQRSASLLAGITFGLSGYLTSYPFLQLAVLETMTWLPLALWLIQRGHQQRHPLKTWLILGLVIALAISAGHPQTALQVGLMVMIYFLFRAVQAGWDWLTIGRYTAVVLLIGLGASAGTWLPVVRYLGYTTRQSADYAFVANGLPFLHLIELWLPHSLTQWAPTYSGLLTLFFALIAWQYRKRSAELRFWSVTTLCGAWLSLGDAGLLFPLLYRLLPFMRLFRQQERWWGIVAFGLALLSAYGYTHWRKEPHPHPRIQAILWWVGGGLLVATVTAWALQSFSWSLVARQGGIFALSAWLLTQRRWPIGYRSLLLLVLIPLDLGAATYRSLDRRVGSSAEHAPTRAWIETLRKSAERIDSHNIFWSNFGELYQLEDIRGISPLQLKMVSKMDGLPPYRRWQLLAVSHITWSDQPTVDLPVTPIAPIANDVLPETGRTATLWRIDQPHPRAWMVYETEVLAEEAGWQRLGERDFDPYRTAILTTPLATLLHAPSEPPQVTVVEKRAGRLSVEVESAEKGLLILSEWAYPGWKATLDGQSVPLFTANNSLQAVIVPAGNHLITTRYAPVLDKVAQAISALTIVGTLLATRLFSQTPPRTTGAWRASYQRLALVIGRFATTPPHQLTLQQWQILLFLLTLVSFGLRVATASWQELRSDEAASYLITHEGAEGLLSRMIGANDPHPPLHYLSLMGWQRLAGTSEISLRWPTILASLLAVPLMAQIGRWFGRKEIGLWAAAGVALSQAQVWIGQDVRSQYAFGVTALLLATWALLRAVRLGRGSAWLLYLLFGTLALYSHYYTIFGLLAHGVLLFWAVPRHRWAWLLAIGGVLALLTPWVVLMYRTTVGGQLSTTNMLSLEHHLHEIGRELTVGSAFGNDKQARWLVLIATLGLIASIRTLWSGESKAREMGGMLLTWLLLSCWGLFLVRLRRPIFNPFYISFAAPAFWLLLAYLTQHRHLLLRSILPLLLLANLYSLTHYYGDIPRFGRLLGYRELRTTLQEEATSADLFVPNAPDPSLTYYLRDLPLPNEMQPSRWGMSDEEIISALAQYDGRYERVWFVPAKPELSFDPRQTALAWLDSHWLHEFNLAAGKLRLKGYRPISTLSSVITPRPLTLREELQLDGFYLSQNGRPLVGKALSAGTLEVSLVWQPIHTPLPANYKVFVHLLSADGRLIAQHDGFPLYNTRPQTTWLAGETLVDLHELTVSAEDAGQAATLLVGLYHPDTGERQSFDSGETAISLMEFASP